MSDNERRSMVLTLNAIAASAAKLADDYDAGRLWPRDLTRRLGEISELVLDANQRNPERSSY